VVLRGLALTLLLWGAGAFALRATVVPGETCPVVSADEVMAAARAAADWIERAQREDGTYLYEYDLEEGREIDDYNVVRHAGVTMSLYQMAAEGDHSVLPAADRGLEWMQDNMIERGDWTAFRDPRSGRIQLGSSSLLLAGLAQRRIATGDPTYDEFMRKVARFLVVMQREDGSFLNLWLVETGAPDPTQTSKYATGEAFWALAMMHRFFPEEGWDRPTWAVADYLTLYRDEAEGNKFPPWADQWAAYGLSEMADWPLNEENVRYARSLSERFGFLVRFESQRSGGRWSEMVRGREARAAGMGTWVEGLTSLHKLASIDPRMGDMEEKLADRIACAAGMLVARQVTEEEAARTSAPEVARGAWFTEGITRMDDQQHALSALLYAAPIIAGRERGE
jgi:hypothetical protein